MIAAVLIALSVASVAFALCGLLAFREWLAFRREGQKHESPDVTGLRAKVDALEAWKTSQELAKLKR